MAADNRDAIVDAIVARMQAITKVNGYNTDVGGSVTRWRANEPAESACPTIDVRDPARSLAGEYTQTIRDYKLTIVVCGFAAAGSDTDGEMNLILEDILKAMLSGDVTFGGLAQDTVYAGDEKQLSQNNVKTGIAIVRFSVTYRKQ
ncbi:MAG: hypothetical protein M0Z38_06755 [Deltaproteobacteria bacterium]|nr:hypothetical protein [Deltaproteobacteria bacterium]